MRWPPRRKRRTVLDLGELWTLRQQRFLVDGRPHIVDRWTSDSGGSVQLTLVDEAVFVERHAARAERRGLVELVRRWREQPDPVAPPER